MTYPHSTSTTAQATMASGRMPPKTVAVTTATSLAHPDSHNPRLAQGGSALTPHSCQCRASLNAKPKTLIPFVLFVFSVYSVIQNNSHLSAGHTPVPGVESLMKIDVSLRPFTAYK